MANDEVGPPLTAVPEVAVVSPTGGATPTLQVAYRGDAVDLFLVMLKNIFLTLVTLGIFTPWAKATRRRYFWREVEIAGQRLEFTGTGRELFFGYLKVLIGYAFLVQLPQIIRRHEPTRGLLLQILDSLFILILIP